MTGNIVKGGAYIHGYYDAKTHKMLKLYRNWDSWDLSFRIVKLVKPCINT